MVTTIMKGKPSHTLVATLAVNAVEKRANTSVCLPTSENSLALVYRVMSWVTVKVP